MSVAVQIGKGHGPLQKNNIRMNNEHNKYIFLYWDVYNITLNVLIYLKTHIILFKMNNVGIYPKIKLFGF